MTDSMIERVSEAIAKAQRPESDTMYADMARAAIEAMRTPTAAMQEAAIEAVDSERKAARSGGWSYNECDITWNAMIDAALNEKAGT
jgi:hypothetical protein